MGKSPGKWIKTVLFGKKSTKSSFSKNAAIEKKSSFGAKASSGVLAVDPPVNADLPPETTCITDENLESGISANLSCNAVLLPGRQGEETEGAVGLNSTNNAEIIQQQQAATKAQAAFRGYLARRAFRALKGIIRLQALIRGHLVRRQAVATLRCMQTIIKFQALVRGRRVRLSYAGFEVLKKCRQLECRRVDLTALNPFLRSEKLSRNAFVIKLVASSSLVMPLSLQYDVAEPNSVWNWLERWSSSRFWEPLTRPKKSLNSKRQKKQITERESGRPKRGVQRVPALNSDSNSLHTLENEKPKRNQRKAPSPQIESVLEQPQNELERVKRNLRKVSVLAEEASDKTETGTDKLHCSLKKEPSSPAPDVSEQAIDNSSEKTSERNIAVSEQPVVEPPPKQLVVDEHVETVHEDHPAVELLYLQSSEKVMNSDNVNADLSSKEDQTKENEKTRRRRSFTGKQEYPENVSQSMSTLPSYMAVTESAKAKLRAQGSPRSGQDGTENGPVRRHSLPSSTNGKLSSLSPRVQRTVHANGKGGNKSDRSLLSPKDEKLLQPGWRR